MENRYKCPECDTPLNESMFCVKCCSKWTKMVDVATKHSELIDAAQKIASACFLTEYDLSHFDNMKSSHNNGGDTDYYLIPDNTKYCQDIIESRNMNFSQGNIFKAAFCFGIQRGNSDYERDLNKIIWFANRELERIKNS